jgi:rifampicin phosphotransferase
MRLRTLSTIRLSDSSEVGSKAAALGELHRRGFQVPPSLVVPVTVCQELLDDASIVAEVRARVAELPTAGAARLMAIEAELAALLETVALAADVRAELRDWMETCGAPTFAVRSSATHEDLPGATFAGQYSSFLDVVPPDVPATVVHCVASLFTARAAMYRQRKRVTEAGGMAVLVQPMVRGDHAGVVFTQAPRRPGVLLLECAPGCGDGVVSGTAASNRYCLRRPTLEVEEMRERTPLDLDGIRAVARTTLEIETSLGTPQDVEYGVVNDGIWILQARPALF